MDNTGCGCSNGALPDESECPDLVTDDPDEITQIIAKMYDEIVKLYKKIPNGSELGMYKVLYKRLIFDAIQYVSKRDSSTNWDPKYEFEAAESSHKTKETALKKLIDIYGELEIGTHAFIGENESEAADYLLEFFNEKGEKLFEQLGGGEADDESEAPPPDSEEGGDTEDENPEVGAPTEEQKNEMAKGLAKVVFSVAGAVTTYKLKNENMPEFGASIDAIKDYVADGASKWSQYANDTVKVVLDTLKAAPAAAASAASGSGDAIRRIKDKAAEAVGDLSDSVQSLLKNIPENTLIDGIKQAIAYSAVTGAVSNVLPNATQSLAAAGGWWPLQAGLPAFGLPNGRATKLPTTSLWTDAGALVGWKGSKKKKRCAELIAKAIKILANDGKPPDTGDIKRAEELLEEAKEEKVCSNGSLPLAI